MKNEDKNNSDDVKKLVNLGSNITGSVSGAVIGFVAGGPPGAVLGALFGPAIAEAFKKVGNEIANRILGPREKVRIGATINYASEKIMDNIKNGKIIRDDDFFKEKDGQRPPADEILEGILLTAQKEYEEKKLKFHGNLLANLVFHPEIDRAQANMLIRLSERLSYRQLCLIAIFGVPQNYNLLESSYKEHLEKVDEKLSLLLQEIFVMYSEGIFNSGGHALLGVGNINPSIMHPQGSGSILFNLMELYNIDKGDLNEIAKMLE